MPSDLYINVLIKTPNKNPKIKRIRNELERIRKIVGGEFDLIEYDKDSFIAYNYKLHSKKPIQVGNYLLSGNIVILRNDVENGDFASLTQKQISNFLKEFSISNSKEIKESGLEL